MLLRLIQMGIGNLFVLGVTIHLFRLLQTTVPHLDIPIFGLLWIFSATLFTFLLGIFGFLAPAPMALVSLIGLLLMGLHALRQRGRYVATFESFRKRFKRPRFSAVGVLLAAAALLQLTRIAFHVWYIPPYVHDTLTYHLPNVAEWVQKGRIHAISTPVLRSYWPATFEVFESWFVVFLHNDLLIQLGCVSCYLLAVTSVYAICRGLDFGKHLSAGVALLYAYTPSVAIHATSCKNDMAVAGMYLFAMALLVDLLRKGNSSNFPLSRRLLLIAMAFCYGVGTKAYAVFIAPGLILLGIAALVKHRLFKGAILSLHPKNFASTGRFTLYTGLLLGSGVLTFYWYVRNYVIFDNPFYPADFKLFGHLIFGSGAAPDPGTSAQSSFSFHSMWQNARNLVTYKILDQFRIYTDLNRITGWGWFNFACGISAVVYGLLLDKRVRFIILCFVVSLLSLLGWVFVDDWHGRFLHFFPPVFAIAFGALLTRLRIRWATAPLAALAIVCSLFNYLAVLNVGVFSKGDLGRLMALPPLQRSLVNADINYPWVTGSAYGEVLKHVPEDEIIGYSLRKNDVIYPLYGSDLSRRLHYIPDFPTGLVDSMNSHGIRYLYYPRAVERFIGGWMPPYGAHQIGVRGGQMATWINLDSHNREYNAGEVQPGKWTHLAFTFSGEQAISYVNGEIVAALDYRGEVKFNRNPHFVIGERSNFTPGEPFRGLIDEVSMFRRILAQGEIREIMNRGISLTESPSNQSATTSDGLVAYYRFNGDTRDLSGNRHDGKLIGYAKLALDNGAPVPGAKGCIRLPGITGNGVDCGESPDLRIASNLTLMAWVNPDSVDGTHFVAGTPYNGGEWWIHSRIANVIRDNTFTQITRHLYALKSTETNRRTGDSGD